MFIHTAQGHHHLKTFIEKIESWNKKKLSLKTWCQIMEWDTDQVAHTFKTKIQI